MSACMLTATLATVVDRTEEFDFAAGRELLTQITDAKLFDFGDPEAEIDALLPKLDPKHDVLDDEGWPLIDIARAAGAVIIDKLEATLAKDAPEVDEIHVGGYILFISGGLSSGDEPTDATRVIWDAYKLPHAVLEIMGFTPGFDKPLGVAPAANDESVFTDTEIVDAIALGLGTKSEWSGADELQWIAETISQVRREPGEGTPSEYLEGFSLARNIDPLADNYLIKFVGEEATPDEESEVL